MDKTEQQKLEDCRRMALILLGDEKADTEKQLDSVIEEIRMLPSYSAVPANKIKVACKYLIATETELHWKRLGN